MDEVRTGREGCRGAPYLPEVGSRQRRPSTRVEAREGRGAGRPSAPSPSPQFGKPELTGKAPQEPNHRRLRAWEGSPQPPPSPLRRQGCGIPRARACPGTEPLTHISRARAWRPSSALLFQARTQPAWVWTRRRAHSTGLLPRAPQGPFQLAGQPFPRGPLIACPAQTPGLDRPRWSPDPCWRAHRPPRAAEATRPPAAASALTRGGNLCRSPAACIPFGALPAGVQPHPHGPRSQWGPHWPPPRSLASYLQRKVATCLRGRRRAGSVRSGSAAAGRVVHGGAAARARLTPGPGLRRRPSCFSTGGADSA